MKPYQDSLRGYGCKTHEKYNFTCQYCGYNGKPFLNWLQLTVDHIVPQSQGGLDNPSNLITVCQACNSITSRMTFAKGTSKRKIMTMKKKRVEKRQAEYLKFWKEYVR